jgi:ATP-dependent DNA ligase
MTTMLLTSASDMEDARRRNVMATELAMKPAAFDADRMPSRAGFELKIDGIGFLDVNSHLQSLEGAPFEAALHLAHELERLREAFGTEMVLHGEFVERDGFNATLSAFRSGASKSGAVILWDAVTLKAWHGFEQSWPLHERRALLQAAFDVAMPRMVKLNPLIPCPSDAAFLEGALDEALDGGHEGLVIKDLDSPYIRARSPWWMKLKPHETIDVPIQAVRVDDGRVRSLIVTFEGRPVVVGSGLSEEMRSTPAEFAAGRMVEIKHVGRTPGGQLRGASFVRFRDDKEARA